MEIFAEVAASRLFWALGFYSDEVYPVRLKCLGCPEKNPFQPAKEKRRVDVMMEPVILERNFPGVTIAQDKSLAYLIQLSTQIEISTGREVE